MRLKSKIRKLVPLVSILLLVSLIGCSRAIILYPIQETDFYIQENNDICMSEFYFKEVLQAKIKEK